MILKFLLIIAVIAAVYFLFFKSKPVTKRSASSGKKAENSSDDTVQCATCGTYVALDDAIISNGKYYCSKECLKG